MIPGGAHAAFEPPIGGVEAVGKMGSLMGETDGFQQVDDLFPVIYADVPLVDHVVFMGQHPADAFRHVARN